MGAVVGITGRRMDVGDQFPETMSHLRGDLFVTAYAECVAAAGGLPVWLSREADPIELVAALDGVLVAGGQDVDPRLYGSVPGPRSTVLDPERDEFEIGLVRAAIAADKPMLGICRGTQVINVALGGSLIADLGDGEGESHGFLGYPPQRRTHAVEFVDGTRVRRLFGPSAEVNSYHHQAVGGLGEGLVAAGYARDGVIEAIELPHAALLGVQWHPEMFREPDPVFGWLVRCCTRSRNLEEHCAIA